MMKEQPEQVRRKIVTAAVLGRNTFLILRFKKKRKKFQYKFNSSNENIISLLTLFTHITYHLKNLFSKPSFSSPFTVILI